MGFKSIAVVLVTFTFLQLSMVIAVSEILTCRCYSIQDLCSNSFFNVAVTIQLATDLLVSQMQRIRHVKNEINNAIVH